jgi:hypothetical protein
MSAQLTITIPVWLDRIFTFPLLTYRLLRFGYTFRRIYLGDDEWTIVEPADFYRFGHLKWHLRGSRGKRFYAVRNVKIGHGRTKQSGLHREIMNNPKGLVVDHKNGDSLDNRRANLRPATRSQNCQNVPKRKNTSSRFIGVSFNKFHKKWSAFINSEGKRMFLGYFDNEIDAACAYDTAARKYYGEFARINFPQRSEGSRVVSPLGLQQETG